MNKKITLAAILTAMSVALGYLFLYIPNVEFISASVFISGFLLGPFWGAITGVLAEMIFSLFSPYGAPILPLLIAQIFVFGLFGFYGGRFRIKYAPVVSFKNFVVPGLYGLSLTLLYDVLTSLSYIFFAAELDMAQMLAMFSSGILFYIIHAGINTLIFCTIVPILLIRLWPNLPEYIR